MKFLPVNLKNAEKRVVGAILTLVLLLCAGVTGYAQQQALIPVKFTNATVQEVLSYLDEKTEYDFVYNNAQIAGLPRVSIDRHASIQEILRFCLKGSNLSYQIRGKMIVIKPKEEISQQTEAAIRFMGVVRDDHGHPMAGVAVIGEGTGKGSVTSPNGEFRIDLKRQDKLDLRFSFLGMKPYVLNVINNGKVTLRDPLKIQVTMESDVSQIDDIVVTGIMNISKKSFSGTSTTITREQLKTVSPTNIMSAVQVFDPSFRLQENLALGSNPNAIPEMYIRGKSGIGTPELDQESISEYSLNNNPNLPIFILDGYEVNTNRIYDLDIERIETFTILKDAAATAMYGSRAANGVIVINTIPPAAGKLNVSYNMTLGLTTPDLSSYNMMNSSEKLQTELLAGIFEPSDASDIGYQADLYNKKLQNIERGVYTDWMALPLRNAVNHRHSVIVSGGADNFKYELSGLYDKSNGVMKGNFRERMNFGMILQYNYKTLQFRNSADVSITRGEESPYGTFSEFVGMNPYDSYLDENGNLLKTMPLWGGSNSKRNPMYDATLNSFDKSKSREFTDNIDLRWYPTKTIHFESNLALTYNVTDYDQFRDPDSGYFTNTQNIDKGSYNKSNNSTFTYDFSFKGFYNNTIGKHAMNFVVGFNARETKNKLYSDTFRGFPSGGYYAPGYAQKIDSYSRNNETNRLMGVLGVFNYSFNDIYMVDLSGRIDGSSQFGANKKYAPFYSTGFGINIHNYKAVKNRLPWLSQLKIKGTYGMTGMVNFPPYAAQNKYEFIKDDWYGTGDGVSIMYMGNPNLKWQKTVITDIGAELSVFDNIFYTKFTYYNKDTKDHIADFYIPSSSGFTSYKENIGRIQNRGYEIEVQVRAVKTKDLTVNLRANAAHNKNKIKEISNALKSYNDKVDEYYSTGDADKVSRPLLRYVEGGSLEDRYGMISLGIDPATGRELYLYKDGTTGFDWLSSENVAIYNTEPTLSGSFGPSIYWKGFTFDCYFMYQFGGQSYNETLVSKVERANILENNCDRRVLTDRWAKPGDVSRYRNIKDWLTSTQPSTRFVQDDNWLKLSSLSLGYEFPREKIEKLGLRRLKLSFNMSDVFTASSIAIERGTSSPFARTFNFSLSTSF